MSKSKQQGTESPELEAEKSATAKVKAFLEAYRDGAVDIPGTLSRAEVAALLSEPA